MELRTKREKDKGLSPEDLWNFIEYWAAQGKEKFGQFTLVQKFRPTNEVMRAVLHHNERES